MDTARGQESASELKVEEASVSNIPGTVYLVDTQHALKAKYSNSHNDIVLIPSPSDHPDDPLNWSLRRKALFVTSLGAYLLVLGLTSGASFSILVPISKDTGLSLDTLNQGTGYQFLLLGWGCLFWQPIALQYGKRIVYLASLLGLLASMIWIAHTRTSGQYLGARIIQGFFGAPVESLCEISLTDISFQHERGRYISTYALLVASFNVLGPILFGFVNDGQGWQWVFYWCAIFTGAAFLFCFLFMEESNWDRVETAAYMTKPLDDSPTFYQSTSTNISLNEPNGSSPPIRSQADTTVSPREASYSRKSYFQKLSVMPQRRPFHLFELMIRSFYYFSLPAVAWAGLSWGSTLVWFNLMYGTASSFLSSPPYNFSASIVGLSFVSTLIGVVMASLYSGFPSDYVVLRLARRNNGIMEPEFRLWMYVALIIITPLGLILWGVGYAHNVHWFGVIFAMGCIGFQASAGVSLPTAYAIDSYREAAGEAIVTITLIRNTMAFAIGYAIEPWVTGMGPQNAFIVAGLVGMVYCMSFLLMIKFGKNLRARSTSKYFKMIERGKIIGINH